MAIDPIGEKPVIRAPEPGESSPLPPPPEPQAPTGFGGRTPGTAVDTGMSSPVTIDRSSPLPTQAPTGFGGPTSADRMSGGGLRSPGGIDLPAGWDANKFTVLEYQLRSVFPAIDDVTLNQTMKVIILGNDPSVTDLTEEQMVRQAGLSTLEMVGEGTAKHMLGVAGDDEAFAQAALDTWLDTGGAAVTAATMFADGDGQEMWVRRTWLEDRDARLRLQSAAGEVRRNAKELADTHGMELPIHYIDTGFVDDEMPEAFIQEVNGLRGKAARILRVGDRLAIRFMDEDADKPDVDVLIYLEPGTEIENPEDAYLAFLLAEDGLQHSLAESSDAVPGRQSLQGVMIELFNRHVVKNVEDFGGVGVTMEHSKDSQLAISNVMTPPRSKNPNLEQRQADEDAEREQYTRIAVERSFENDGIVAVTRQVVAENPDIPLSAAVAAGMFGFDQAPDELKEAAVVQRLDDLEAASAAKAERQTILGKLIEEDIAPPMLDALAAWDAGIHFIGIVALDVGNNGVLEFAKEVQEKGLAAFTDPESLARLSPLDSEFFAEQFQNVMEVGLPLAMKAYGESVEDIGTIANYYGIDPESGWASWVNLGGSILFDPITWATLGGAASWNAMKKGVFTAAGTERILGSRPIMSAARGLVVNDAIRMVPMLSAGGMRGPAVARLARIARTVYKTHAEKVAAIEEVLDIMRIELPGSGMGGMWIPSGPAKVLRRKSTLGLAQLAGHAVKDPKARSFLQDILIRASRNRFTHISERNWLDNMFHQFEIRRLNDVDGFADDIVEFTELFEAYRGGDDAIGLLQAKVEVLRGEMSDLTAGVSKDLATVPKLREQIVFWDEAVIPLDDAIARREVAAVTSRESAESSAGKIPGVRAELDRLKALPKTKELEKRIKALETEIVFLQETPAAVAADTTLLDLKAERVRVIAQRDEVQTLIDELHGPGSVHAYELHDSAIKSRQKLLDRYKAQMESLGTANRDRSILEHASQQYFDDWADEWGIPLFEDVNGRNVVNPRWTDLKRRNWDAILGEGGTVSYYENVDKASALSPFSPNSEKLKMLGLGPMAGTTPLPVSPQELLAWHTMNQTAAGRATWKYFQTHQGYKKAADFVQSVWAASVLFNPRTAFRSHLDEVVRFYDDSGISSSLVRSTTPSMWGHGTVGSQARSFARDEMDNFLAPSRAGWAMVSPSQKGQWVHAERWVNGMLMNDELFQGFARAYTNGADDAARRVLWEEWWNKKGVKLAKVTTIDGTAITGGNSYDILSNSFDQWLSGLKTKAKKAGKTRNRVTADQIRDDMLGAAARGEQVKWDPVVWRQLPDVPAQQTGRGGFLEGGFNIMYGSPQSRRGSVFYDHYYEWAYGNYRQAYEGKVIDVDWLIENGKATSKMHAEELLNQARRSHVIRDLLNESGMVLDADLHNAAMQWAAAGADDMMYTFGATSMLGSKMARIYPFGRAQVDYLQWWWNRLMQPTQWGANMGPGGLSVSGGAAQFGPVGGVVGGAGRMATVGAVGGNVRLIDRMAHLAILGEPDERPGAATPAGVINNFTFLPYTIDDQLVIETTPNLGPGPSWLLNAPLDDVIPGWTGAREAFQELHPAHRIYSDPSGDPVEWIKSALDVVFPKGGLSIRNEVAAFNDMLAFAVAAITLNYDPSKPLTDDEQRRANKYANAWILSSSLGPWRADYIQLDQAKWLETDAFKAQPDKNSDSELMIEWAFRNDQASVAALREDTEDFFAKMAGVPDYGGSDFQYVETMMPVVEAGWPQRWLESGSIQQSKFDGIMSGYQLSLEADATGDDKLAFADEVLDVVFHFLTDAEKAEFFSKNRGFHVNMVSSYRVVKHLVPSDARADIDGERIDPDASPARKRELRAQGKDEGWLVYRDSNDVRYDSLLSAHRSFRSYLDVIYRDATDLAYGARSRELDDGTRRSISDDLVWLTPEWWQQHGEWLEKTEVFTLSSTAKAALVAGEDFQVNTAEFKETIRLAKKAFTFVIEVDSSTEAKLTRIGLDDRPKSVVSYSLSQMEGFDRADFDQSKPMSYYGEDLMTDFKKALAAGQEWEGWETFDDWERDYVAFTDLDDDGNVIVVEYSIEDLRSRFKVAVLLSGELGDALRFTEDDFDASIYGRELGELFWEAPEPPPLSDTLAYMETTYDDVRVIDGDTLEISGPEGLGFVRFIGINAPEEGQPGYEGAHRGLNNLLRNATDIQLVVFDPERYGTKTSSLAREGGLIVHRDRLLVWLYVDGVPYYDVSEFSPTNVRGIATGGEAVDYTKLANGGRSD